MPTEQKPGILIIKTKTIKASPPSQKMDRPYNGEQYDTITSQYYLRARYYNPLIGRFTQEDVYRGDGLNLYAYCGNNPVMYVDPSGYNQKPVDQMGYDERIKELNSLYKEFVKNKNSNIQSTGKWFIK